MVCVECGISLVFKHIPYSLLYGSQRIACSKQYLPIKYWADALTMPHFPFARFTLNRPHREYKFRVEFISHEICKPSAVDWSKILHKGDVNFRRSSSTNQSFLKITLSCRKTCGKSSTGCIWISIGAGQNFHDYSYLLSIISQYGETPLIAASSNGHTEVCKVLINDGKADVNKEAKVQIIDKLYHSIKTQECTYTDRYVKPNKYGLEVS